MGCNIHMHIEWKEKNSTNWIKILKEVCTRDYELYGALAGVRNYSAYISVAEKRGIPDDASCDTIRKYCYRVADDDIFEMYGDEDVSVTSKTEADKYVAMGLSQYWLDGNFVSCPDYHSESWCTARELKKAIEHAAEDFACSVAFVKRVLYKYK